MNGTFIIPLGLVVGAGVESEDVAYVPSNVHSGGHFYNSKSFELEGLEFNANHIILHSLNPRAFLLINILTSTLYYVDLRSYCPVSMNTSFT